LQHDTDLSSQPWQVHEREIDAIDQDSSACRNVKALHQLGERALSRARRADDSHHLTGSDVESDVAQNLGRVRAIAERHVLEGDVALNGRQRGAPVAEGRFGDGVENVAQSRHRNAGLVKVLPNLRQPQHRRADAAGKDIEGDELADRKITVDDQLGAKIEGKRHDELADQLHRLARPIGEARDAEA
jgi:hypothetical protein